MLNEGISTVSLDFNNELGSNGRSYKLTNKTYLEKIDLLNNYASFVRKTAPQEGEDVDRKATARDMTFKTNSLGDPILPDPNETTKPLKDYVWYPTVVRKFMHFDWGS